jgi:hypothetical protein
MSLSRAALLASTILTGVDHNELIRMSRKTAPHKKRLTGTWRSPVRRLRHTNGREREYRDRGIVAQTRLVQRNAAGEVPD